MVAAARSTKYNSLGVSAGPEDTVLVASTNIDVSSTIDFAIVGPAEGVEVTIISGTAHTGTPSVVFTLQGYDVASDTWESLVSSAAVTNNGTTYLLVSHHAAAVTNKAASRLVRERMRLDIAYTGTPTTDVLNGVTVSARAV